MNLEMYIENDDLEKLLGAYFTEELKQPIKFNIYTACGDVTFNYRKFEKINKAPVIVDVTLEMDEVKAILSTISDKYDILNMKVCTNDTDDILGFYMNVKEKSFCPVLGAK